MKRLTYILLVLVMVFSMITPVSTEAKKTKATTEATSKKKTEEKTESDIKADTDVSDLPSDAADKEMAEDGDETGTIEENVTEATTEEVTTTAYNRTKERVTYTMSDIDIEAESAIVIDYKTGEILYKKNEALKSYPASIAKLMTAIIAYENMELSDVVRYTKQVISSVPKGETKAGIKKNERLTVKQSMNLLLLYSANDAANGLAYECSGNVEAFAELMNEKAKELGCENTNFVNAGGSYDEKQVTTAEDMALIAKEAYSIKSIRKIMKSDKFTLTATNKRHKKKTFRNPNRMMDEDTEYYYEPCVAGRTGYFEYTEEEDGQEVSKQVATIVSYAKLQDRIVCAVVLGGSSKEQNYVDTINLFDYIDQHADLSVYKTKAKATTTAEAKKITEASTANASDKKQGGLKSKLLVVAKIAGVVLFVLFVLVIIRIIHVQRVKSQRRRDAAKRRKARERRRRKNRR